MAVQPDLAAAIAAVEAAAAKEPEPADRQALEQALAVLRRVQATNQRETGGTGAGQPSPLTRAASRPTTATAARPPFGSPAWRAMYSNTRAGG